MCVDELVEVCYRRTSLFFEGDVLFTSDRTRKQFSVTLKPPAHVDYKRKHPKGNVCKSL